MVGIINGNRADESGRPDGRRRGSISSANSFSNLPSAIKQSIVVGCVKEIKTMEDRVGLTPSAASEFRSNGHYVVIQKGAGLGSGFSDKQYEDAGCMLLATAAEVYACSHMIVKVKEPLAPEYDLIREGQVIFTYFHFASSQELTEAMIRRKAVCIAYETIQSVVDGSLPLLTPMSEIAGRMSVQEGAKYLERPMGGRGVLLGGVPGVLPGRILIVGGGVVGLNAAKIASGTGADVVIMDINVQRLRLLDDILPRNCRTLYCNISNLTQEIAKADLVIGAVLVPGAKAPKLVKKEHLKLMKPGAVIVDVAVDQGGCCESTRVTTHDKPTFVEDGVVHYCVGNMPGAVPCSSTVALGNVTLKYGLEIANKGWYEASKTNVEIKKGLNIVDGNVVYQAVAETFGLKHVPVDSLLNEMYNSTTAEKKLQALTGGLTKLTMKPSPLNSVGGGVAVQ